MNKDFKEAMQAKVIEIYGKPPEPIKSQNVFDENYHRYCDSVMDFEVGWNACYAYLQKEGGKDLVTGVHQDSNDIGDAPLESSNSIEQEEKYKLGYKDGWDDAALYERRKADAIYWQNEYEKLCKEGCSNCGERF